MATGWASKHTHVEIISRPETRQVRSGRIPARTIAGLGLLLAVLLLLGGCLRPMPPQGFTGEARLQIELSGFRNDQGQAIVALFADSTGFPDDTQAALRVGHAAIISGQAELSLTGLAAGRYAVSVLHDENNDGQMETGWLGGPREGFGFSGRPHYHYGPPDYESTLFTLPAQGERITIRLRYDTIRREHRDAVGAEQARPLAD